MLFFSIYNIPIYKIYCDLNNYYFYNSSDGISRDKYFLYFYNNELSYFSNFSKSVIDSYSKYAINHYLFSKEPYSFINSNQNNLVDDYNIYTYIIYFIKKNFNNYFLLSFTFVSLSSSINPENINNFLYIINFKFSNNNVNLVEFISLQNNIYIVPGETYLIFFRIYNPTDFIIKGISIYFISPNEINLYLFKIQCFCFDELLLYEFESVDLPILFYIASDIVFINVELFMYFQIHITYLFILSNF